MRDAEDEPRIRAIGSVNWLGVRTLYVKEVRRFMKVFVQTVLAPVVSTLLLMTVFSLVLGKTRGEALGLPFVQFLAPGLVMSAIIGQAFANSSSSLIVSKMQGGTGDFLMPPLSAAELTAGFVGGAATRGLVVGLAAYVAVLPFAPQIPANFLWTIYFALAASIALGAMGALAGIWAQKFDHLSAVTNFVITPLTFLSGAFYSISILPEPMAAASRWNPLFHMIDGFRYGVTGVSDAPAWIGALALGALNAALLAAVYLAFQRGWRMKV